jgi:hypothetical protein
MFEETSRTLLCSDLFHQDGDVEPITTHNLLDRVRGTLANYQAGPLANYVPCTRQTGILLERLAQLNPATLATMHGSSYSGDGAKALRELAVVMREVLGGESATAAA